MPYKYPYNLKPLAKTQEKAFRKKKKKRRDLAMVGRDSTSFTKFELNEMVKRGKGNPFVILDYYMDWEDRRIIQRPRCSCLPLQTVALHWILRL
ncbi:hypothetical protein CCACVL1_18693 [Corchorus capsularis]|uniref:Uncharacterized protein n=1 Tax=Corchorus capsularis TaxID=210143 RepID=A0A1R3HKC4_COCAP|nr:hypothetical protein CCACVL1_18693 [Corchorus capsularis]